MRRLVLLVVGVLGAVGGTGVAMAPPAGADCAGPSLAFEPASVARGGEVTVAGTGFGDNCYDTGPPPAGEGVLGKPQRDIEVYVVQGANTWLVAKGDADAEYRFEVTIVVPTADIVGGEALLVARLASGGDVTLPEGSGMTITDDPPVEGAVLSVVPFGGAEPEAPSGSTVAGADGSDGADGADGPDDGADLPYVPIGIALVLAAVAACVLYPRMKLKG